MLRELKINDLEEFWKRRTIALKIAIALRASTHVRVSRRSIDEVAKLGSLCKQAFTSFVEVISWRGAERILRLR